LAEKVLLDVELADVRDGAALDGVVGEEFGAVVDDGWNMLGKWDGDRGGRRTVEMVGAADVVAGDYSDEGGGAVGAGLLETAEGVAGEGGLGAVAIALGLNPSVDTLCRFSVAHDTVL
jgi:hypothetical protein